MGVFAFIERPTVADETPTNGETPEVTPPAGETPAPSNADGETPDEPFDPDRAKALIAKLRQEAKDAARLSKRVKELEGEKLSETEKLQREYEDTKAALEAKTAELRLIRAEAATRDAGAIYPDLVADRIPAEAMDDPKALAAAVKDLKAKYPTLFRNANGSADGGAGQNGVQPAPNMNDLIRDLARNAS